MTRLISGLALAVAVLAAILFLPVPALRVVALAVAMLATHEFLGVARSTGGGPSAVLSYVFVALTFWQMSQRSEERRVGKECRR